MNNAKQSARELIDQLPDQASWDELMYELYVKQKIDEGLLDLRENRIVSHQDLKQQLLNLRS